MGRHARRLQRVSGVTRKRAPGGEDERSTENDQTSVDIHEDKFFQDEIDEFHLAKERLLLEGHSGSSEDDGLSGEEVEVLGWSEEGEESEEEEEEDEFKLPPSLQRQFLASDDEEEELGKDSTEISDRAWGQRKKTFYAVEGEDQLSGSEGSEMAAELEEKEAVALQQRLTAAISEADFMAPALPMGDLGAEEGEDKEECVVQDFSKMSREDKLSLLERDSPELFDLLEDFGVNMSETVDLLRFQYTVAKDTPTFTDEGRVYLDSKLHLDLLYCMNIMFYLHLKASGVPVKSHPVIQRLVEIKKMIGQLEPLASEMEGQIEALLLSLNARERELPRATDTNQRSPALSVNSETAEKEGVSEKLPRKRKQKARKVESEEIADSSKKRSAPTQRASGSDSVVRDVAEDEDPLEYYKRVVKEKKRRREQKREKVVYDEEEEGEVEMEDDGKRAVTYQIARNRGLIPQRKKELRNPRVKHRNRFRKALIRHKGQVRQVVKELKRYGGEASGIRANISHSIRIK